MGLRMKAEEVVKTKLVSGEVVVRRSGPVVDLVRGSRACTRFNNNQYKNKVKNQKKKNSIQKDFLKLYGFLYAARDWGRSLCLFICFLFYAGHIFFMFMYYPFIVDQQLFLILGSIFLLGFCFFSVARSGPVALYYIKNIIKDQKKIKEYFIKFIILLLGILLLTITYYIMILIDIY